MNERCYLAVTPFVSFVCCTLCCCHQVVIHQQPLRLHFKSSTHLLQEQQQYVNNVWYHFMARLAPPTDILPAWTLLPPQEHVPALSPGFRPQVIRPSCKGHGATPHDRSTLAPYAYMAPAGGVDGARLASSLPPSQPFVGESEAHAAFQGARAAPARPIAPPADNLTPRFVDRFAATTESAATFVNHGRQPRAYYTRHRPRAYHSPPTRFVGTTETRAAYGSPHKVRAYPDATPEMLCFVMYTILMLCCAMMIDWLPLQPSAPKAKSGPVSPTRIRHYVHREEAEQGPVTLGGSGQVKSDGQVETVPTRPGVSAKGDEVKSDGQVETVPTRPGVSAKGDEYRQASSVVNMSPRVRKELMRRKLRHGNKAGQSSSSPRKRHLRPAKFKPRQYNKQIAKHLVPQVAGSSQWF